MQRSLVGRAVAAVGLLRRVLGLELQVGRARGVGEGRVQLISQIPMLADL